MKLLPLVLPLLLTPLAAAQTGTLDQQAPFGNASFNGDSTTLTWQQQVRAGTAGTLEGVTLSMYSPGPGSVDITIRMGSGWSAGTALFTGSANTVGLGPGNWESIFVDTSAAGITLAANDVFVIEMAGTGTGVWIRGSYVAPPGTPSYPEPLFLNGSSSIYAGGGWIIGFETWMVTGPPPFTLAVNGSCPSTGSVAVTNATPGGLIAIASALSNGPFVVPSSSCAGTQIGLINPTLRLLASADGSGALNVPNVNIPAAACGNAYVQALDMSTCAVSNLVTL